MSRNIIKVDCNERYSYKAERNRRHMAKDKPF